MAQEVGPDDARVLGPVVARWRGEAVDLGSPQQRAMFAILLARAGEPVPMAELTATLWGATPPRSAKDILYRYANGLRDALEPDREPRTAGRWIRRVSGSYQLVADGSHVDAVRFRRLTATGRVLAAAGDRAGAVAAFGPALDLWQGPAAADLSAAIRGAAVFRSLENERNAVLTELLDAAAAIGGLPDALPVVYRLLALCPLDERLHADCVRALIRLDRRAEAETVYARIRDRVARDLAAEPGPELRSALPSPPAAPVAAVRPAQLPAGVTAFSGRAGELAALTRLAGQEGRPVAAITGMAGVGKTALALRWAHDAAAAYPDGQLYVNLRGFDPDPAALTPAEVLFRFLEALGVDKNGIPADTGERAALFRSILAGRRILIVLDNARNAEQVRPLLPGTPDCHVLLTSRSSLAGLVDTGGAYPLTLRLLDPRESAVFLADRLGDGVLSGDPGATGRIVGSCGGLPLALAIVAARIAAQPAFRLADVAAQIQNTRTASGALAPAPDADVRTAFSWSYRILSTGAARLFRWLAIHPGPEVSTAAAASALGIPPDRARSLLHEIADAQLVQEHRPGRFACHDLLRAYAAELLARADDHRTRRLITARLADHYLQTAAVVSRLVRPELEKITYAEPLPGVTVAEVDDLDTAVAWYDLERPALVPLLTIAHEAGLDAPVYQTAFALMPSQDLRGHWADWKACQRLALDAATRAGEPWWRAVSTTHLARGHLQAHEPDLALFHYQRALTLLAEVGDRSRQANAHLGAGDASRQLGRPGDYLAHLQAALPLYREAGDVIGQAWAEYGLGDFLSRTPEGETPGGGTPEGETPEGDRAAVAHLRAAIDLHRRAGNRFGEGLAIGRRAELDATMGRHERAAADYRLAAGLFGELRQPFQRAEALAGLTESLAALGDRDGARAARDEAVALLVGDDQPAATQLRRRLAGAG